MTMLFKEFIPGQQFLWRTRVVELDAILSPSQASVRDRATGCLREAPLAELEVLPTPDAAANDPTRVAQDRWDEAKRRTHALLPYTECGYLAQADARRLAQALKLSERQLRREFARLRASPSIRTLVAESPGPRQQTRTYLNEKQEEAMRLTIERYYLVRQPKRVSDLMDSLRALCKQRGCLLPSESTVRRRIVQLDERLKLRKRQGRAAANQQYQARPGSFSAERPLEVVQIDHTRVDLAVNSDDCFRMCLGRPWLTVMIDIATRCILGFYLSFDAPSAVAVGVCLAHAVTPKAQWLEHLGLAGIDWPMYGKPRCIHTDNGKDFWSLALQRGCEEAGIKSVHRPPGGKHWGGHIERVIGTLMQRMHALPGTTFSNVAERGDYPSEQRATLTLAELREWLVLEIVRYHARVHKGLTTTPYRAWTNAHTDAQGLYRPPALIASPRNFLLQFLPSQSRTVRRGGVEFETLRYWHDGLAAYVGSTERQSVYYDPRDISHVYMHGSDGAWIELSAISQDLPPISLFEYRAYRMRCRDEQREPALDDLRAEAAHRQTQLVSLSMKKTRQAHRRNVFEKTRIRLSAESGTEKPGHTARSMTPPSDESIDPGEPLPIPEVESWETSFLNYSRRFHHDKTR
ncbi:MAG: Mu transposase C-terminal domain-containing protein [Terriglobia bacterium]